MAKILDNLLSLVRPNAQSRLVAARREYDGVKTELSFLGERYASRLEKKKNAFLVKANKRLQKSAFLACDKAEYIAATQAEEISRFDKKLYLRRRAVNHKAAKAIFAALRENASWQEALALARTETAALDAEREGYLALLETKREEFLAKNALTDDSDYRRLEAELRGEYEVFLAAEEKKNAERETKEREELESRLAALEEKIGEIRAEIPKEHTLPDDVLVEVKNLKMYFGGLKAVDDLTFNVKKGEIFGLIGPNGAGKTTVFNCITRFYDATAGEMYFENKYGEVVNLRDFKVHDIILQGIGRTFQNIELVKEISVIENLLVAATRSYRSGLLVQALGLPSLHREEELLRKKAEKILKFMGLDAYTNWLAMGLPYGVLKKVEIARALMADAKLIIMDEPAAGLNDSETAELTETIRKIRDEFGVTILLVEHDMGLVMNVCDTVCAISFGQMLAIGTTEEIKKNKAVQEAYLGVEEEEK